MKKILTFTVLFTLSFLCFSQNSEKEGTIIKNKKGIITSVEFSSAIEKSKIPSSSNVFFETYLEIGSNDEFKKVIHKSKRKEFVHDHFDQYYQGVKVDGAGYNLHYKNGRMYFANGNYIKIDNVNPKPSVSLENAINSFIKYKGIQKDKVVNKVTNLMIKEIVDSESKELTDNVELVYRIYLESDDPNNNEVGYLNAHTGMVMMTEPRLTDATGTFATRYSNTRQAETDPISGGHRLFDDTRAADIHTRTLQNNTTIYGDAIELTDNDNNWTAAEHSGNNNDMGLDVHWGLQEIYDHLNGVHGINSFDDAGETINAYIRYGNNQATRDNAHWNPTINVLAFGQGVTKFSPLGSIDVVAHEFGHGITDFQIGWGGTFDQAAFNEGMSDIWGAIFEQRIRPSSTWRIGEQITLNKPYLRNIQNTNDTNADTQIADTYQSTQYNNTTNFYVRSGVFSHWFYILVNGENGTNDVNDIYSVDGIGLDLAEELILEAVFNNYLDGTTTYPAIRTAIINAAEAIFCEDSQEVKSVTDAWYAVGVGNAYTGSVINISGSDVVCASGTVFTVNNLPTGATINWTSSSNISRNSSQGSNPCTFSTSSNSTTGWIKATITLSGGCDVIIKEDVTLGTAPIDLVTFTNGADSGDYFCTSHYGNTYHIEPGNLPNTTYQYRLRKYPNLNVVYTSPTGRSYSDVVSYTPSQGWYEFQVRATNSCGTGSWVGFEVEYVDCSQGGGGEGGEYRISPNPASSTIKIEINKDRQVNSNHDYDKGAQPTYELYDFYANVLKKGDISDVTTINVSSYKKGIYILKINFKGRSETHQVIIE